MNRIIKCIEVNVHWDLIFIGRQIKKKNPYGKYRLGVQRSLMFPYAPYICTPFYATLINDAQCFSKKCQSAV